MAFSLFLGWIWTNILSAQDLSITYNDKKKIHHTSNERRRKFLKHKLTLENLRRSKIWK
jgi:hypothetical protein